MIIQNNNFFRFLKIAIPKSIWAIGFSSLFVNIATSIVFAQTALYLTSVFHITTSSLGYFESFVAATAYAVRLFSGVISDYFRQRKVIMIIGYVMITISSPLLAIAGSFFAVCVARAVDRVGNGIQGAPREALISDISPKKYKGACFGLRQSMSVLGSAIGGGLGIVVMLMTNNNFKMLFLLTGIPSLISVFILFFFVKEKKRAPEQEGARKKICFKDAALLGKKFWLMMIVVMMLMLGRFSEVFIVLHANTSFAIDVAYVPIITIVFNVASALIAYPIGKISDKMDKVALLFFGFALLLFSHLTLGFASNISMIIFGTFLWGLQSGVIQSILATLIAEYVPKDLRGTAFGIYFSISAISTFIASSVAGILAEAHGVGMAFIAGAGFSLIAIFLLWIFNKDFGKATVR